MTLLEEKQIAEIKKNWRKEWLECLLLLSDIDLQKERWLNKDITNPGWTYVDFMSGYFDDLCIKDLGGYKGLMLDGRVTRAEYECVKDFHAALDGYKEPGEDPYNPEAILNDERWQAITAMGAAAMKCLEKLITDAAEKEIFTKRLYAPPLTTADFTWPNHQKKPH